MITVDIVKTEWGNFTSGDLYEYRDDQEILDQDICADMHDHSVSVSAGIDGPIAAERRGPIVAALKYLLEVYTSGMYGWAEELVTSHPVDAELEVEIDENGNTHLVIAVDDDSTCSLVDTIDHQIVEWIDLIELRDESDTPSDFEEHLVGVSETDRRTAIEREYTHFGHINRNVW